MARNDVSGAIRMGLKLWQALKAPFTRLRGSVRLRLLVRVLLFTSVLIPIVTATQLYLEYRRGVETIESQLIDVRNSYLGSLSEGLWRLDREYLQIQLDGILRLSDIRAVEVRESSAIGTPMVVRAGRRGIRSVVSREFPIVYRVQDKEQPIGTLYVEATLANLYRELTNTALIILVSQGLEIFLASLFIIYIVHRLISRHLAVLADFVHGYDILHPPPPVRLPRPPPRQDDELEQLVAAINAMHARTRRLVDSNIVGILFGDATGKVTDANDVFLRIIGYDRKDLLDGRIDWQKITPPEYQANYERSLEEIRRSGSCTPYEKEYFRKDGSRVSVLVGGAMVEKSTEQLIAFVLDLTEHKRAETEHLAREAADAANRAKSEFLANMSHELRSPLNIILGYAQLLGRQPDLPPGMRDDLGLIRKSGEHLYALINQVLDLSMIEAGRATLNEIGFDLHRLLDELEDLFTVNAEIKGLQLSFERSPDVPRYVRADQTKLRQVLINLLGNALKFTRAGSIGLSVGRLPGEPSRLAFVLKDTGSGIAANEMGQLFEAFAQAEAGRQMQEGTGLGLKISRSFVRLMGGDIHLDSQPGQGTTVSFDIPLRTVEAGLPGVADEMPRPVVALAPGQPLFRILVADDDAEARRLLVRLLAPLGFEMREAANGQEAVEIWQRWQPHLIWMDMRMPVLDGREATRRIKARRGDTRIIALTASSFEEDRAGILEAGCDDFLRKPFREADLFELMQKHLGVRFIYRDEASAPPASPAQLEAALAAQPGELLRLLEQALVQLDAATVTAVIARIEAHDAALAQALNRWAQLFQYEPILNLIRDIRKDENGHDR